MHTHTHTCMYAHMHICTYTWIHTHTHTHTHMHIHTLALTNTLMQKLSTSCYISIELCCKHKYMCIHNCLESNTGEFGIVYKAHLTHWHGEGLPKAVAVKTLKGKISAIRGLQRRHTLRNFSKLLPMRAHNYC